MASSWDMRQVGHSSPTLLDRRVLLLPGVFRDHQSQLRLKKRLDVYKRQVLHNVSTFLGLGNAGRVMLFDETQPVVAKA